MAMNVDCIENILYRLCQYISVSFTIPILFGQELGKGFTTWTQERTYHEASNTLNKCLHRVY